MAVAISGYQVNEVIHESSNSLVYRGSWGADNQLVILKMLKQAYPSPEKIAWFKREYEITRDLNLTGVVKAYSLETDQHRLVMALEDFGGESLTRLGLMGRLPLLEFLSLAIQVVDILGQVHQRHIMHKDINPSNIVLNPVTRQVKLIDFGIATALSRENPTLRAPNMIEGTLAYISPEQTGRMNRAVDYRTDFYSLGVTFYELLTGQLPFPTTDAMELVHAHIAKQPPAPYEHQPTIPRLLSDMVIKLMTKGAEDRYQSAYGLKTDLEECLRQWQATGRIDPFPLGQHDISDRFQISQKLYGREPEVETLLAAFERVSQGASEMMLVTGYAGIGKSALVQEIYKPITRRWGYFIAGKFDQLQRNIPYASLVQAFRTLMRQLLTESEAQVAAWREKLLAALGPNGQVIIEVIPEVELIIGPQPTAPSLSPAEAQNRFNLVFQNFIRVFTQPEHPLVIFLDDLQWTDAASLSLLQLLMTTPDSHYLFVIGAYRDNEVGEAHPLLLTLEEIQQAKGIVNHIVLAPLALPQVNQLTADTLNCTPERARPLAELVLAKTNGNPFFMNEFLKSLYSEGLLEFVPLNSIYTLEEKSKIINLKSKTQRGGWQWDLEKIQARGMTDNVVDLMTDKVRKLGEQTQQVLKLAACIGNQFDLQTLAIVYQKSPRETAVDLWAAMMEGLVLSLGDAYKLMDLDVQGLAEEVTIDYKFAHDRIQQAVYSLIPVEDRQIVHWQVGQLLWQNTPPDKLDQKIFDIVNHLNLGKELINRWAERAELAELNLAAGQKAKASAAYQPAFNYLQIGLDLLGEDSWERQYDLTLTLHVQAAEAAYLSGNFEQMERLVEIVLQQGKTLLDKVTAYEINLQAYYAQYKLPEMMEIGLEVLKLLGVEFPEKPSPTHVGQALEEVKFALAGRQVEDLIDLPEMTDLHKQATMRILSVTTTVAAVGFPEVYPLLILKAVNLSIQHGHMALSPSFYAAYGLLLCGVVGDIDTGYQFGKLALRLVERLNARKFRPQVIYLFNTFIRPWKEHVRETIKPFLEVYQGGLETGDLTFATFATFMYVFHSFWIGRELVGLEQELAKYSEVMRQLKQEIILHWHELYQRTVLNLLGRTENPCRLSGESYNEETMLSLYQAVNDRLAICYLYLNKLALCCFFQEPHQAIENGATAEKYLGMAIAMQTVPLFHFYDSLAQLAVFPGAVEAEQERILAKVDANQAKMEVWTQHAPMNFLHKFYLVKAERARVLGDDGEAREYYDQAIDLARENEYLNEEALAHELAAHFYLARGQTRLAQHYLRDAHYAYLRWGAMAKVKDLETRYPQVLAQAASGPRQAALTTTTTSTGHTALDLTSVLKASQAISGEIVLDKLLATLMKIVIENAGAQTGYLLLDKKGQWLIEAAGVVTKAEAEAEAEVTARQAVPVETSGKLAIAIVNYVARTRESVVLNDTGREGIFTQDPYIRQHQPKSILCLPLINQGELDGILYLENNLTTGAFTPDRQEVLNLLSGQAAISIENARLYSHQVALTNAASRFVPYEFLRFLHKDSLVEVELGDHVQMEMTILVSDIRSFTTLSEKMTPKENFDFINAYFQRVAPVIRKNHGFIGKYIGDGIMAFFPRRADDAIRTAIETMQQLALYNAQHQEQGQTPIQTGIGLHTGSVMLGTVGEAGRMQGDVMSDAANLATRLEGLTKFYGVPVILSAETLHRLEDPSQYHMRFLGKVQVQGRQEAVSVFDLFDGAPTRVSEIRLQTKSDFEQGLSLYYQKQFAEARAYFEQVLQGNGEDRATQLYLTRTVHLLKHGVPDDWSGVEVLTEK